MTIDIKAQLELLKELQEIDIHLRETEEELSIIPELIKEAKAEWTHVKTELDAKSALKVDSERLKHQLEIDLEDSVIHLREREAKLYAIKTNKEYQAALKEIADGKRANREREDEIIKLMEKIEGLSKEITQLSGKMAEKEEEFKKEEAELRVKQDEILKEREVRASELEKVRNKVDKTVIDKYNFIRERYNDPLAAVINGICRGCNMNVPPQMYIELLKGIKIRDCPNCRRIIYVGEEKEDISEEGKE